MKKTVLFVLIGLLASSIPVCAGGFLDRSDSRQTVTSRQVAEGADVAEVPVRTYRPRRNPAVQRADSSVYALPADPLNPEAERLPPPVYAISGIRGQEIMEGNPWEVVDIVIDLPPRETFAQGILEGEDVSHWIQNLPPGLEARAHGVRRNANYIKIYVSGKPEVTMRELIRVTIPGTYLSSGQSRNFVSPTEEDSYNSWVESQTAQSSGAP